MKVWVAELHEDGGVQKFELRANEHEAMYAAANMMLDAYWRPGNACEGDDPLEFRIIKDFGGKLGLTKIIWITEGFFPGAAEVSVYEKEVKGSFHA